MNVMHVANNGALDIFFKTLIYNTCYHF